MRLVFQISLKGLIVLCLLALGGCGKERESDTAQIKKSYVEFRAALIAEDYARAGAFISSNYVNRYPNLGVMAAENFRGLKPENMELRHDSWVRFDRNNHGEAWLFPRRGLTVGSKFLKETNGWKITVDVLPIVD